MSGRRRPCDDATIRGRLRKAEQFWDAAESVRELADDEAEIGDVYVTLCIHAAIAAADVVCCVSMGEHAVGENHNQAIELVRRTRPDGDGPALRRREGAARIGRAPAALFLVWFAKCFPGALHDVAKELVL